MGAELVRADGSVALAQTNEGFGTNAMVRANETSSSALAAQARAQIEARYIVAMKNPRDWSDVRVRLLRECSRPGFADVARYSKPVGGSKIEGPTIRFAEAALRCMTNITPSSVVIWDDEEKRIVRVSVTDVEANLTYEQDIVVAKTVERNNLAAGQQAISSRTNSRGAITYTVRATEDDLLNKQGAQVSKALRTQALRLLPGDILEECMDQVLETQRTKDAKDPDAAKKKLIDAFAKLGVLPKQLAEYLGHDTAQLGPAELTDLRAVYAAISQSETTWQAVMASKKAPDEEGSSAAQKAVAAVKDKLAQKQKPANDQKKQDGPKPAQQPLIDTAGESVLTFNARFSRDLGGKPYPSGTQAQRAQYNLAVRDAIKDLTDNQPAGWEAQVKPLQEHQTDILAEHEALCADEALGNG